MFTFAWHLMLQGLLSQKNGTRKQKNGGTSSSISGHKDTVNPKKKEPIYKPVLLRL